MSHLRDVVHPRRMETVGFLVAGSEPCITLATEEQMKQSGRTLVRLLPEELTRRRLPRSWALALVVCDGDDVGPVVAWASRHRDHLRRIHVYLHRRCDPRAVLAPWHEAGLPLWSTWDVGSWRDLGAHFGRRLNLQAHDDFCPDPRCPLREP